MCRSLEEGGRRCDGRGHRSPRSTEQRSREYFRRRARKTGEPDPYDELDEAFARLRAMRKHGKALLLQERDDMVAAGLPADDAQRLYDARLNALGSRLAALSATFEFRWTVSTWVRGKARRIEAQSAEVAAKARDRQDTMTAVRLARELATAHRLPGEGPEDTVTRLRLVNKTNVAWTSPTRLALWADLEAAGHIRDQAA